VKPAKILILRSFPRTSDRITVSPPAGFEVDGESGDGEGIAGPRLFCRGRWFLGGVLTARVAVNRWMKGVYRISADFLFEVGSSLRQ